MMPVISVRQRDERLAGLLPVMGALDALATTVATAISGPLTADSVFSCFAIRLTADGGALP
jgi:hypothetical protein